MEFGLLGTLEVWSGNGPLPLRGPKQRALLAYLLLHPKRVLAQQRLIDELWGEAPPETAVKALQGYVSQLRKLLPAGTLLTHPPGYVLEVEPEAVDLWRFERIVADARNVDPARASRLLGEALALWRGPPLAGLADEPFVRVEAGRLEELRLAALEERIDADLALGRHAELVGELEALVAAHPERERLRGQLMLGLYRSGRQSEALEAYRDVRATLHELGLEPGVALKQLERQILTQDGALEPPLARLLATGRAPLPGALVPASPFPFVGRARELATLQALLERAEGGEGALALVGGDAGSGKTRLVRELAHTAAERGVLVLYGVSDATVATPYQPLREWLTFAYRVCEQDRFRDALGTGEPLARLVPELARVEGSVRAERAEPANDRRLLQDAASALLDRISRQQPLLLVADDLHWADGETLELLRRLARTAPEARLLVVALFRDRGEKLGRELADTLAELARLDGVERLSLGALSDEEVAAFIRASTDADASAELVSAVGELSSGTPLLLCELWRELLASSAVEVVDHAVHLSRPLTELRGAERFRDLVRQRLARLTPETAALVELAAVAGPRFELRVLGAAAAVDARALAAEVEQAVAIGVIEELPEPAGVCRFTHELVRRAVYDGLTGARRAALHLRVGEALETTAADALQVLPELAHHFTLAAPIVGPERAVEYNLRAADAAMAAAAYAEAGARLSSALELGIAEPQERRRVQLEAAYVLRETGHFAEAEATLAQSLRAEHGREERGHAAHVSIHQMHQRMWHGGADLDHVTALAEEALRTFEELGDRGGLAEAGRLLALAARRQGRGADARAALEQAIVHAYASGDPRPRRTVTTSLAFVLCDGPTRVDEAVQRCSELMQASVDDGVLEAAVGRFLSALLAMAGHSDEARELVHRTSVVLDGLGSLNTSFVSRREAAVTKELLGDRAGADHDLEAAWRWFRDMRAPVLDARAMHCAYLLGLHHCEEGRWDEAERLFEYGRGARELVADSKRDEAVLRLALGARLAAHRGDARDAVALAERAVERAATSDLLNLRARLSWVLADVRRTTGADTEADAAVAEAVRLYELKGNVAAASRVDADARR